MPPGADNGWHSDHYKIDESRDAGRGLTVKPFSAHIAVKPPTVYTYLRASSTTKRKEQNKPQRVAHVTEEPAHD